MEKSTTVVQYDGSDISDYYSSDEDNNCDSTATSSLLSNSAQDTLNADEEVSITPRKTAGNQSDIDSIDLLVAKSQADYSNCFETDSLDLAKIKRHTDKASFIIDVNDDESFSDLEIEIPLKSLTLKGEMAKGMQGYSNLNDYFKRPILKRNSLSNAAA